MDYVNLVARALSKAPGEISLADLLWRVDELRRRIPLLPELNAALSYCQDERIQFPVTPETYSAAVAKNRERMKGLLAGQGISLPRIERALGRYVASSGNALPGAPFLP